MNERKINIWASSIRDAELKTAKLNLHIPNFKRLVSARTITKPNTKEKTLGYYEITYEVETNERQKR